MKHFCTLSDINYLTKGIAMYNSLLETSKDDFVLYYLCLDLKTFDKLEECKKKYKTFSKIIPQYLGELELKSECQDLVEHKKQYPATELVSHMDYCFTLASYYTDYLLKTECKDCDSLTYLDSDIYFYQDIQNLFDEIGSKHVGIIPHRHISQPEYTGFYNVSIVYFKNSDKGKEVLHWWKNAVLTRCHPELHTCGDQKYLDEFIPRFGEENICVIKNLSHGAPWNYRLYVYDQLEKTGKVVFGNDEQLFVFNHFSKFMTDGIRYIPDNGIYNPFTFDQKVYAIPEVKKLYDNYFNTLKRIKEVINV